ncbi:hypothetical protein BC832DRAFT_564669 [Gaertneriomyces semiglobifer]|nr:hypothetical protein BC832DRAFT_564669 [Gaertneriomyces semiglobifer]
MDRIVQDYFGCQGYASWSIKGCLEYVALKKPPGNAEEAVAAMVRYLRDFIIGNSSIKRYAQTKGQSLSDKLQAGEFRSSNKVLLDTIDANDRSRLAQIAEEAEAASNSAGFGLAVEKGIGNVLSFKLKRSADESYAPAKRIHLSPESSVDDASASTSTTVDCHDASTRLDDALQFPEAPSNVRRMSSGDERDQESMRNMVDANRELVKEIAELKQLLKRTKDGQDHDGEQVDDESVDSHVDVPIPPVPATGPTLGRAVAAIRQAHMDSDARHTIFWNALDLREPDTHPLASNPRADSFVQDLLDANTLGYVRERMLSMVERARALMSNSVQAYLFVITSLVMATESSITIASIAEAVGSGGVVGVIEMLKKEIRKLELEDEEYEAELTNQVNAIDHRDADTQWVNLQWVNLCDAIELNIRYTSEKTMDAYFMEGFLKKRPLTTLFGELTSIAEKTDKAARGSDLGRAKKCDYILVAQKQSHRKTFIYDELSAGENSGRIAWEGPHSEENFVDGMKVARAQYRTIVHSVVRALKGLPEHEAAGGCGDRSTTIGSDHTLTDDEDATALLLDKLGVVYLQVVDLTVVFRLFVGIRRELFAFGDIGTVTFPSKVEDVDKAVAVMDCFLLYHNLARLTHETWQDGLRVAKLRGRAAPQQQSPLVNLATAMMTKRGPLVLDRRKHAQASSSSSPPLPLPPKTPLKVLKRSTA